MIVQITVQQVIAVYDHRIGAAPLRDLGALESAVYGPFHTFGGHEPYPTLVQKAGKLLHGIQAAQAYVDGNKRLAWLATNVFVEMNGQHVILLPEDEVNEFVRYLAECADGPREAAWWLNERLQVLPSIEPR